MNIEIEIDDLDLGDLSLNAMRIKIEAAIEKAVKKAVTKVMAKHPIIMALDQLDDALTNKDKKPHVNGASKPTDTANAKTSDANEIARLAFKYMLNKPETAVKVSLPVFRKFAELPDDDERARAKVSAIFAHRPDMFVPVKGKLKRDPMKYRANPDYVEQASH